MTALADAIAFHINAARRALVKSSAALTLFPDASTLSSTLSNTRDVTRRVCDEHALAMHELLAVAREATQLTVERRIELLSLANRMRATAELPPVLMEITS